MNAVTATTSPLLQPLSGYPDAYLATRLVPRLAHLFAAPDMQGPPDDDELGWSARHKGIVWSYMQLSPRLRRQCEPLYVLLQAPTLLTAMRFSTSGQRERAEQLLAGSLWNKQIKRCLTAELDAQRLFSVLCQQLAGYGWPFEPETLADAHPQYIAERHIYRALLRRLRRQRGSEPLQDFSAALHDLYNLAQCRYISDWPPRVESLPGGHLPAKAFHSPNRLSRAVNRHYGPSVSDDTDAEHHLRVNYARTLKQRARIGGALSKLLAFLWAECVLPESRTGWQRHLQEQP